MATKKRVGKSKRTQRQREIMAVTIAVVATLVFVALVGLIMNLDFGGKKVGDNSIPVEAHGRLSVQGKNIVDEHGKVFQLRGVSTHGINLTSYYCEYINPESLVYMRDEWGVNAIRLARYTPNNDATWVKNVDNWDELVKEKIQCVVDAGMYVLVDWHVLNPGDPNAYKDAAIAYFTDIAKQYQNCPNIIYEICNEPNGVTWNDAVKPYAEAVIAAIRKVDKQAIIAVGSSTWSQDLDQVAVNPITGYTNLVYTMHFYAGTHKDNLRNKLKAAVDAGLPVLISEFGMCNANGDGEINYNEAAKWMDLLNENQIGYMIWQLTNKAEGSSLIRSDVTKYTGWTYNELAAHGQWFVDMLHKYK